jgi:hypothetical protein
MHHPALWAKEVVTRRTLIEGCRPKSAAQSDQEEKLKLLFSVIVTAALAVVLLVAPVQSATSKWETKRVRFEERLQRQSATINTSLSKIRWYENHKAKYRVLEAREGAPRWVRFAKAELKWTTREREETRSVLNRIYKMTLPNTNDWTVALRIAQRPYPGTFERGMQIADHEGSRGEWRWWGGSCSDPPCLWRGYHIGDDPWGDDTVGGNAQFRYSTFIVYWPQVVRDLNRRGFIYPDLGWARPYVVAGASTGYGPWLSPLGQALTLSYMHYYGKQGSHWNF